MGRTWSDRVESLAARAVPAWVWEKWYRFGMRVANRCGDRFVTHHTRPKYARAVRTWSDPVVAAEPFAVVMQGPVVADGFTLETLRIYARLMPHARRILSTWEDTDPKLLDPIRAAGVDVVLSPKPPDPGLININLQLASTLAGMRRAKDLGCEWVVKTRADQRMYATNVPEFLVALVKTFPAPNGIEQRARIVGLGHASYKYVPYCLSDQTQFGHIDDMLRYWSAAPRGSELPSEYQDVTKYNARHRFPECYLATEYLRRLGRPVAWTLEDSWAALADHFMVVEPGVTDLYWPKYLKLAEHDRSYAEITSAEELDFKGWLLLHAARANRAPSAVGHLAQGLPLRATLPAPQSAELEGKGAS